MKRSIGLMLCLSALVAQPTARAQDLPRWKAQAARITIVRDNWGVPHVYGKSDADAVFGLIYAQAEDDFNRVETNYINALGRLAEVEGEKELYRDLRMKLFIDPVELKSMYTSSPVWLKALMDSWADGLNFYLAMHPTVKPRLITKFEPWMALSFSEGSIGGDIESVSLPQLQRFYGAQLGAAPSRDDALDAAIREELTALPKEPQGSNGFAISPANSASGRSLLLINPHTSFYFRPEVHVNSEEGLSAYGAVTWGQFFVYQGFNNRVGWMHTSGGGDVIDEYLETVTNAAGQYTYKYGSEQRAMRTKQIALPYRNGNAMASKTVTAYFTGHGPVVSEASGKWVAVAMMNDPQRALTQSYMRTKARSYAEFLKTMDIRTNSSNNTVYADADGNIAYFHGNYIPKRDTQFNFKKPVDGSDPRTEWTGLHDVKETINLFNPKSGWLANTNNWPFSASGVSSPVARNYPVYMNANPENARGIHAKRVLDGKKGFTLDGLIAAANDSYLPAFEQLIPTLLAAYDAAPATDTLKKQLAEQIKVLRAWDYRYSITSVPTALAIFWGDDLMARANRDPARGEDVPVLDHMASAGLAHMRLESLGRASAKLQRDFGKWQTPWGDINRFQRLTGDIVQPFDDSKPSLPVPFTSSTWGSLAAFGMTTQANVKKIYGDRGNSFMAVVEFGPRIKAKSLLAGGVSGDPKSKHFTDQALNYTRSQYKDVLFYREDVDKRAERTYHPGN
ncbi:MAG: penicillin acylase family protein [Phycisphaerae bacterium]|nr:penicillin acylase family protein [Gemmatimonadaceae bacterium]